MGKPTNISDTTLKNSSNEKVNFRLLKFPYKVLEDVSRQFQIEEQPSAAADINTLISSAGFYFNEDVKVEAGKEGIVDLGCITGTLIIKATDENGKDVRQTVRISKADNNEMVSSSLANRPIELAGGKYNIEVLSTPRQSKKDVSVKAGEESSVEFTVKAPVAAQKSAAPSKPAAKSQPVKTAAPIKAQ